MIGASYADQKYDPDGLLQLKHVGVDARLHHESGFRLQAEWMRRSGDDNPVDLAKGPSADAGAWYAQTSWRIMGSTDAERFNYIEPVFMIEGIDNNRNTDTNADQRWISFGLNYSPESFFIVKFEYDIVSERNGAPLANNGLWFSVVAEF